MLEYFYFGVEWYLLFSVVGVEDQFEKISSTEFLNAVHVYRPSNIVVGLNKEWENRYSFYKSDPSFLEVAANVSLNKLEILLGKMSNGNLFISLPELYDFIELEKASNTTKVYSLRRYSLINFFLRKGIIDAYMVSF